MPNIWDKVVKFFSEEEPPQRFPTKEQVIKFLGLNTDSELDSEVNKIVNKWFFISERTDIIKACKNVEKRYEEMIEHFNLFIDAVFVNVNSIQKDSEAILRSSTYIEEFKVLLDTFEKFVFASVSDRIVKTNNIRNKVKVELGNE